MYARYTSISELLGAYAVTYHRMDDASGWDSRPSFRADEDGIWVTVDASSKGWHVELHSGPGDFEETGRGELNPLALSKVIETMRRRSDIRGRIRQDQVLADLGKLAQEAREFQERVRYSACQAVRNGATKVAVAKAVGISRPTLDAWLEGDPAE